ncbi:25110_t:CDS:2, partial [Racocetra persica]
YPIALAFKIVGRSRSDEEAIMMEINWICDEWRQCFIDGGWAPHIYVLANAKLMTTNNLTEHIHKMDHQEITNQSNESPVDSLMINCLMKQEHIIVK